MHAEQRTAATGAFNHNAAAMGIDQLFNDTQPKPRAIAAAAIPAPEAFEKMGLIGGANAGAKVAHADLWPGTGSDNDVGVARCVRERIVDKVAVNPEDRFSMPVYAGPTIIGKGEFAPARSPTTARPTAARSTSVKSSTTSASAWARSSICPTSRVI